MARPKGSKNRPTAAKATKGRRNVTAKKDSSSESGATYETRIVQAAGTAVGTMLGASQERAARLQKAQSDAILKAMNDGIALDSPEMKRRSLEALEKARAEL